MNLLIGITLIAIAGILLLIHGVVMRCLVCLYTIQHDMARICAELARIKAGMHSAIYPLGRVEGNTFTEKTGQEPDAAAPN